mgnify:CR=1 FL=1
MTTTTPDDLDPALRRIATGWEVGPAVEVAIPGAGGAAPPGPDDRTVCALT